MFRAGGGGTLASDRPTISVLLDLNLPGAGGWMSCVGSLEAGRIAGVHRDRPPACGGVRPADSMPARTITSRNRSPSPNLPRGFERCFAEEAAGRSILQIEDLEATVSATTVRRGSHNIDLSPKEFRFAGIP